MTVIRVDRNKVLQFSFSTRHYGTMKPETLTDIERLQLVNQYLILQKVDPANAEHWTECSQILREGYTVQYHKIFDPLWDELPVEECQYVMNVLEMHHVLKASFARLADKSGISEDEIAFHGFSGNEESHLLCFADKLKAEGRWHNLLEGMNELDAHFPTTWRYKPMLEKWSEFGAQGVERKYDLSKEQLRAILDAPKQRVKTERGLR